MLNVFFILRNWAKQIHAGEGSFSSKKYSDYFCKKFYTSNLKVNPKNEKIMFNVFPSVFTQLKTALESSKLDYELSLDYNLLHFYSNPIEFYPPYSNLYYSYKYNDGKERLLVFQPILSVKLYFPKIIIKNSTGKSHIINDLFVKFQITASGKVTHLYGARVTFTPLEKQKGYKHSHLSSSAGACDFSTFCLGYDSAVDFAKVMVEEAIMTQSENLSDILLLYINTIKSYLEYESLEGGPYIKISSLIDEIKDPPKNYGYHEFNLGYENLISAFSHESNMDFKKFVEDNNLIFNNNGKISIKKDVFESVLFSDTVINSTRLSNTFKLLFTEYTYHGIPITLRDVLNNMSEKVEKNNYTLFAGKKYFLTVKSETKFDNPEDIKVNIKQTLKDYAYKRFIAK